MIDFLIVGAGPAGMSAAVEAIKHGAHPVVVDNRPEPGGNIYAYLGSNRSHRTERMHIFGPDYAKGAALLDAFLAAVAEQKITYHASTKLWQVGPQGGYAFHGPDGSQSGIAKKILLATGAQERPMPISGWTLPGVMGVGAAQILMKSGGELPKGNIVIVGAGPLPLLLTEQLHQAGRPVSAVVEPKGSSKLLAASSQLLGAAAAFKTSSKGAVLLAKRFLRRTPVWRNASGLKIIGNEQATGIQFTAEKAVDLQASIVLIHDGIIPNLNPLLAASLDTKYSQQQQTWHAQSKGAVYIAGDGAGILGVEAAVLSGRMATLDALGQSNSPRDIRKYAKLKAFRKFIDAAYPAVQTATHAEANTILCRCEMITAGDVRQAVEVHGTDPNAIKRSLRIGMGPCQGRMCAHSLADFTAAVSGVSSEDIGLQRARSPILPVSFRALSALKD
ncbi:NADPH-dependent 2,4-dienoyl-CoA reductase/sulfur reductase-like enzyme [Litoreibacter meonggei]|uniref:NADPH-dependent 2,4-dienoyl-CoA reductase/sulfur reductase-like enzyme n=1 Tax=Litoreibacter meonggei TaxID=1049199 RepID=A0A497X4B8_9RHOB|nr:NAD(P)/FAD-dependent oxidoreductase [Litoreibacter meonggei]RLJ60040.1 NADPH-dependent 2,4-dienoyl-CoA reductase/sulfur reductase-like enzyme [Litoreibacter meonggei]